MAIVRCCVRQILCLSVLILVSPWGCDGMVMPDGAVAEDPVNPSLEKSTTRADPYQQVNPLFDFAPPLPTQLAAPSTRNGDEESPPVRSHISHAGTNPEKQHGTINSSQDSQAYISAGTFNTVENNADTNMPSSRQDLPSKSVGKDEDRNGQAPEVYPGESQFLNNPNVGNAPSSTQKTHTGMHYPSGDRFSESGVLKEAEKKQVSEVQAEGSFLGSYKDHNTQVSQTEQKDSDILGLLDNHFSENDAKTKESQEMESNWGEAQNTKYKDSFKSEKSPSNDDTGMLETGLLGELVSRNHSGMETDVHSTKIQTLSPLVSRSYTEHTTLSSSKTNANFKKSEALYGRPSFEGAKLTVSHSVGNLAESASSTMQTEKTSPEKNSGMASQEKEQQAFTADQEADKSPGVGYPAERILSPPSSTASPDVDWALATKEQQTTNTDDTEAVVDDWWYFDPDYKEEDEEHSSPLQQLFPGPQHDVAESKDVNHVEDSTFFSEIHEKVVKEEDVAQKKKKKTNTPKNSIIIYTVGIAILVTAIVLFFLWKNTSKKGKGRNLMSIIPTGDEGKRLLDHPFV